MSVAAAAPASALPNDLIAELTAFRRDLHRHPEPGADTARTAARIAERLEAAGLVVTRGVGGHGVVATLSRGAGRAVGFRADMDALPIAEATGLPHASTRPGAFHGCGHDGHSTMLLGAALALSADPGFAGTAHFIFQPDEENGLGALAMIADGLFDRFPMEAVYGLHNMPGLPAGTLAIQSGPAMAFEDNFEIRVTGAGGHASAPHRAVDAIVAGAAVVGALQTVVARGVDPDDFAVVSVTGFETDGARNVLASNVRITGDCRGYSVETRDLLRARMRMAAEGAAAAVGARAEMTAAQSFAPLVNRPGDAALCLEAAEAAGLAVRPDHGRIGGAEDFAAMLAHRPGAMAFLGNGTEGPHGASLHNPGYDFNDAAIPAGVAWWAALARRTCAPG
ncbi:MAG: amidohydrolase [Pseudomonadota bacterium]|nr:amidohydrolase [Pseudomonadota bacterium]MEE3100310.1 amidohydrolase [Pseudomonadota bacterium]